MSKRNPTVATHPDLFEKGETAIVKSLDEMTRAEIVALPRSAFSDDEWDELDDETQAEVVANDPEEQERLKGAAERIEKMVEHFVGLHEAITKPDERWISDRVEEEFDMYFSDMGDDAVDWLLRHRGRDRDKLEDVIAEWEDGGYSNDQIVAALNVILQDRDNWSFSYDTDEYGGATFKAASTESFYMEKEELAEYTQGMDDDEIEEALEEINRRTYLDLSLADIEKGLKRYGLEIDDYTRFYADADIDWDAVGAALKDALEEEEPTGETKDLSERIIHRFEDGGYVVDLLAEELPAEGRGRGLCVGSKQYGFIKAVEEGRNKIFSVRRADGERVFTIQAIMKPDGSLGYIGQVKAAHNQLPTADQVEWVIEFLKEGLGLPLKKIKDISDLKPALREAGIIKSLPASPKENPERGHHCGFCAPCHQP